jgi:GNAT superfamily N-acetyltransferase
VVTVVPAEGAQALGQAKRLFQEYNASIGVDLEFQGFDSELASLPGRYAPPEGRLLLAVRAGEPVGCVALRRLEPGIAELKRLYVRPAFREGGVGRRLVERVIAEARIAGYRAIRLDTLPWMDRARSLYEALGFRPIPAYGYSPIAGSVFLELDLRAGTSGETLRR